MASTVPSAASSGTKRFTSKAAFFGGDDFWLFCVFWPVKPTSRWRCSCFGNDASACEAFLPLRKTPTVPLWSEVKKASAPFSFPPKAEVPTRGSAGHGLGACKPCAFFYKASRWGGRGGVRGQRSDVNRTSKLVARGLQGFYKILFISWL